MKLPVDIAALLQGDRNALSKAITFMESDKPEDRTAKWNLLEEIMPYTGKSIRIGISGSPGVGKSSFIDRFGSYVIDNGHKTGVLAIDPSSSRSGGSILGDRTRMRMLSSRPEAFIRPSPAAETLGGIAARSREVMLLMEAAGYDIILIETVGVGQSEVAVRYMVDYFILLLQPGAGDDLQGIKRGIMEMADLLLINKADGAQLALARRSMQDFKAALHLFSERPSGVAVEVLTVSALQGAGIEKVWQELNNYVEITKKSGYFHAMRKQQEQYHLEEGARQILLDQYKHSGKIQKLLNALKDNLGNGTINPAVALHSFDRFMKTLFDEHS